MFQYAIIVVLLVMLVLVLINNKKYENMKINRNGEIATEMWLDDNTMQNGKYKMQYRISGLKDLTRHEQYLVVMAITDAIEKIESIITTTTHGTQKNVRNTPRDHITKDVFIDFELVDLDGTLIGQTGVWEHKEFDCEFSEVSNNNQCEIPLEYDDPDSPPETRLYYPTMIAIELNKQSSIKDAKSFYNTLKYPWARGKSALYYLVLHEILHGLGIGGLWSVPDISNDTLQRDQIYRLWVANRHQNPHFNGPAWKKYGGSSATNFYYRQFIGHPPLDKKLPILLEDNGIEGTRWWHWEQGYYKSKTTGRVISKGGRKINGYEPPFLQNEIMVGWDMPDIPPLISTITIANLEDLGYEVDYSQADVATLEKANHLMRKSGF